MNKYNMAVPRVEKALESMVNVIPLAVDDRIACIVWK